MFSFYKKRKNILSQNGKCASHEVESLFTIVPIQEIINYKLAETCIKKIPKIYLKLIFKPLLPKLLQKIVPCFNFWFSPQCYIMDGPFSVIL